MQEQDKKTKQVKTKTPKTNDTVTVTKPGKSFDVPKTAEKTKPQSIITREQVITRENGEVTPYKDPSTVIDSTVFDDDIITTEPVTDYYHRSSTIDDNMLSGEQVRRSRKKSLLKKSKSKSLTIDFSGVERYEPNPDFGLAEDVVQSRVEQGCDNYCDKRKGKTYISIFISNIFTFFNVLCFLVMIALLVVGAGFTQLFFIIVISLNIIIGIIQECRSKYMIDKLSLITAPSAVVIRGGEKKVIPTSEVVLDDIICFEMGKQICADCVVVRGECEANESLLTGESEPVKKKVGDTLYSGSFLSSGSTIARVDKVGKANYIETLSSHVKKYQKPKSEIMSSIKLLIKILSPFIILLGALTVYTGYAAAAKDGMAPTTIAGWKPIITGAAGSVIGMIPAGMFLLTSIALAVSVIKLGKRSTLVQDLYCIEMLARVDVLCLDKTGTITDGAMEVNNVIEIKGYESDFSINDIIGSVLTATGDNNQTALALAQKFGYSKAMKPTAVIPFSSQRKLSAVTFEGEGTYMIGAPEFVLKDMGVRIERIINENASNGYRVMVLAHSPAEIVGDKLPAVRRPICLIVIEDHIRENAEETIQWFKDNNVAIKVISGDNPVTVSEVAKRVGVEKAELYISLEGLSNQEVLEAANKYTVFGRVTPEQKRLLVHAIKGKQHTVAMTGDGVNDILAMREADCSVAMASGSEAARNVSHLVLLNNDFSSMPDVVKEGRRVVNNIQSSSAMFLMKTFMSIMLSIIFLIMGEKYPLQTNNLLTLEVCIVGVPSVFLALQGNNDIIKGKFMANVITHALPSGIALVLGIMSVYTLQKFVAIPAASVTCMYVFILVGIGMMVLFKQCEPFNAYRIVLVIGTACFTALFMYVMPQISKTDGLGLAPLDLMQSFFVIAVTLASYFVISVLSKIFGAIKLK